MANTWERYGPKARRDVRVHGDLRYFLFLAIEGSPDVVELCEVPYRFRVNLNGKWVTAKFDLWCRAADGQEYYFDAFYLHQLKSAEVGSTLWRQLRARELWAAQNCLRYAILTDTTLLRFPIEIANWSSILSYLGPSQGKCDPDLARRVRRCVEARGSAFLEEIAAEFAEVDSESVRTAVFLELHAGRLEACLRTESLSAKTVFHAVAHLR